MLVDPVGLTAAAARLGDALEVVTGDPVHPPLGADPASIAAARRLSTAASALAAVLAEQLAGLAATADRLEATSAAFTATDAANAHRLATLTGGTGAPTVFGGVLPATALPPDVRAPLPPATPSSGEAIATAVHAGDPAAGAGFSASWARVAAAAGEAAETVRSVIARLPEVLNASASTPAVGTHLGDYATALETAGRRAAALSRQAAGYAAARHQAGEAIPHPREIAEANERVRQIGLANLRSRGALAVPFAQAQADARALDARAVSHYDAYAAGANAATVGEGSDDDTEDARQPDARQSSAEAVSPEAPPPEAGGELGALMPAMVPAVLGAAGGLLGGLMKAPESLVQGGVQAIGVAAQGLSGLAAEPGVRGVEERALDVPSGGDAGLGDLGGGGAGGATSPMAGGPLAPGSVMPSTGPPPTQPVVPTGGGVLPPPVESSGGMGAGMPMGMPLGGFGGAPAPGGEKRDEGRSRRVVVPPRPHGEAVTGKVDVDRVATASTGRAEPDDPPQGDDSGGSRPPVVRRITMPTRDVQP